jgi:predicted nucleic acid-binding Zn ribbon protein
MVDIEQLRNWRARPDREAAIGPLVEARLADAERTRKRLGSFVELWETVLPGDLASHTRVTGIRGGVVQVSVDTSATAYELDRRLREGLEEQMRRAYGKTFVRVKITVGG